MLRTILMLAVIGFVAVLALRLFFGLAGLAFGLFFAVLQVAIVGGLVYLVIRLVSPDTARRIRDKFSKPGSDISRF